MLSKSPVSPNPLYAYPFCLDSWASRKRKELPHAASDQLLFRRELDSSLCPSRCVFSPMCILLPQIQPVTEFMDCTSSYHYDARTQTYHLPVLSADLLTRIMRINKNILSQIPMQKDLVIERMGHAPKAGASLLDAVEFGIRESFVSPLVLEHVLTELGAQTQYVNWPARRYMISP